MKKKDLESFKSKSISELKQALDSLKNELTKLRLDFQTKKLKNVHILNVKRKEIAKIMTLIREKELSKELK